MQLGNKCECNEMRSQQKHKTHQNEYDGCDVPANGPDDAELIVVNIVVPVP